MKSGTLKMSSVLILLVLTHPVWAGTYLHPLDTPLKDLARASTELEALSNTPDADLQGEVVKVRARISELSFEALLVPLRADEKKLSRLGYDLVPTDNTHFSADVRENTNKQQLQAEALKMQKENWEKLSKLTAQARADVIGVALSERDQFPALLTSKQKETFQSIANQARADALRKIGDEAGRTVECIQYFSDAFANSGLRPVEEMGQYVWSADDLKTKFGVSALEQLSASQKPAVAATLQEMMAQANAFQFSCVPLREMSWMAKQKKLVSP